MFEIRICRDYVGIIFYDDLKIILGALIILIYQLLNVFYVIVKQS